MVRPAVETDLHKIYALYKEVAQEPIGIARTPEEVTEDYIKSFMRAAASSGIELVIENPANPGQVVAEIHCYKMDLKKFRHILGDLTIAIHPNFQGQGLGKLIFTHLLQFITSHRPDVLRVELVTQESNERARLFYQKIGFIPEGRFLQRIPGKNNVLEADIPMAWFNPAYTA